VTTRARLYRGPAKRALDIVAASVLLVVASPVIVLIGLLLLVTQGRPILFLQARPGRRGALFGILKFRTMRAATSESGRDLPDEQRLTAVGRLLRRLSLDELPELVNVIKGDMSLVGPRPLLPEYLPLYTPEQARRHEVRPGITGWAQVNGRNALTWEEKFELDVWYADHVSLALDLRILAMTAWSVLRGSGVSAEGHATMPKFTGSQGGAS